VGRIIPAPLFVQLLESSYLSPAYSCVGPACSCVSPAYSCVSTAQLTCESHAMKPFIVPFIPSRSLQHSCMHTFKPCCLGRRRGAPSPHLWMCSFLDPLNYTHNRLCALPLGNLHWHLPTFDVLPCTINMLSQTPPQH